MKLLAIAMFLIGLGLGGIVSILVMRKTISEIHATELDNFEFIKKWSDLTDKQYNELREYVGGTVDLLKEQVNILIKTDNLLTEAAGEMVTAVDNSINAKMQTIANWTASHNGSLERIKEDLDSMQTTSDNRWELIHDYIVNNDDWMSDSDSYLQDLLLMLNNENIDIKVYPDINFGRLIIDVSYRNLHAKETFDLEVESRRIEGVEARFVEVVKDLIYKLKEDETNEQEMAERDGAPEGRDAGNQEAQQDAVLPGQADGVLVQSELEEDRLDDPSEAQAQEA